MKSAMQIFIIITLLIFYSISCYADSDQYCYGIATVYAVKNILANNKTETVNCHKKPELCTTNLKEKDSIK